MLILGHLAPGKLSRAVRGIPLWRAGGIGQGPSSYRLLQHQPGTQHQSCLSIVSVSMNHPRLRESAPRRVRRSKYTGRVRAALEKVWQVADRICGKRLVAAGLSGRVGTSGGGRRRGEPGFPTPLLNLDEVPRNYVGQVRSLRKQPYSKIRFLREATWYFSLGTLARGQSK